VELARVKKFEAGLLKFVKDRHQNVLDEIIAKKQLDPELERKLAEVVTEFKKAF
jgi:F-type H+-transporting ATPase subunit alpha